MTKITYLLFIVCLTITSCVTSQNNELIKTIEPTIQPSATISYPEKQCFQEKKNLEGGNFGSLIMINSAETEMFIKILTTGENKAIPIDGNTIINNIITSSESDMYAYQTYSFKTESSKLHVIEFLDKPETVYDLSNDIRVVISIIDRSEFLVSIKNAPINGLPVVDDLAVLDVSLNKYNKINLKLPNISNLLPFSDWEMYSFSGVVPSKDFKYFVYQKFWDNKDKTSMSLWDYQNNRTVTPLHQPLDISFTPQWSSDGTFFIISGPVSMESVADEFFKVMISGEVKQLTKFKDNFPDSHIGLNKLSPDNKTVGFSFYEGDDQIATLLLLNLSSGELLNTCIPISMYENNIPLWAPGSNALIVGNYSNHISPVYLVDIINRTYTIIDHDRFAKGWIIN